MTKAERLFNKLRITSKNYLKDADSYKHAEKEFFQYILRLAYCGKLFAMNTCNIIQNVNSDYQCVHDVERLDNTLLYSKEYIDENILNKQKMIVKSKFNIGDQVLCLDNEFDDRKNIISGTVERVYISVSHPIQYEIKISPQIALLRYEPNVFASYDEALNYLNKGDK